MCRNNSIDIFRYMCAILVVAIHTHPLTDINASLGFIATNVIPRVAVPFFFSISGYYLTKTIIEGKKTNMFYVNVCKTYIIWSLIYLPTYILSAFLNDKSFLSSVAYYISHFFVGGTVGHFWYFPALFYSLFVTEQIIKRKKFKYGIIVSVMFYIIGCLGFSYYSIGTGIPIIGNFFDSDIFVKFRSIFCIAFPFVFMGSLVYKYENKINVNLIVLLSCYFIFLLEIYFVKCMNLCREITLSIMLYPLVFVIIVILMKNPLKKQENAGRILRKLANFMYYIHPMIMWFLDKIVNSIFNYKLNSTIMFIMVVSIASLGGIILNSIKHKKIKLLLSHII